MYNLIIKRVSDIIIAFLSLIILSPLFLLIYIWIKLDCKGPAVFTQKRIGRFETEFNIYKFRTMKSNTPSNVPTHKLKSADKYITRPGRFLRKTSLDELPQLINILRGQMSFVGPRPALWNQYDLTKMRKTHNIEKLRPGLTGWAQVNGRDEISIPLKVKLDAEYVQKISLLFDIKIICKTFINVLHKEGVAEGGKKV